jgi:hypothetical protein
MATTDGGENKTVGCGGLLLIPFSTVAIGARLLVLPGGSNRQKLGPYRAMVRREDQPRPLTPAAARMVGTLFLFWTLLLPGALFARAVMLTGTEPAALVVTAGMIWIVMFVGHLISMKLFQVIEPRLPHDDA